MGQSTVASQQVAMQQQLPQQMLRPAARSRPIWIFGYGSLIHTPNFEYQQRVTGYIRGYKRVWHQGSTDHR